MPATHRSYLPPQILAFYNANLFLNFIQHRLQISPRMFANFYSNKVPKLHPTIKSLSTNTNTSPHFQPRNIPVNLTSLHLFLQKNSLNSNLSHPTLFCDLDPIPTLFLINTHPHYNINC